MKNLPKMEEQGGTIKSTTKHSGRIAGRVINHFNGTYTALVRVRVADTGSEASPIVRIVLDSTLFEDLVPAPHCVFTHARVPPAHTYTYTITISICVLTQSSAYTYKYEHATCHPLICVYACTCAQNRFPTTQKINLGFTSEGPLMVGLPRKAYARAGN